MQYQVLARRYRPRKFAEVVGQESVAATLRGGILQDRVAHAYLFSGPRGVGKTSMARIFAKALNCPAAGDRTRPEEEWGVPCDGCEPCEAIHVGQDIDVVEMDAASHRGIEDVRSIIENVNRRATRSPYKVFIVDEVHMLTREAFNALLKTLEEPPPHVKFVFATTEPHRIPETVLSRCQRFDFHPIGEEAIVRRLEQILEIEKREAEEGLLQSIARYGRGGLRDAQTLLDQLLTFSEDRLRTEDLERITGRMPESLSSTLAQSVIDRDAKGVVSGLAVCAERGADPAVLLEQIVERLREELHAEVSRLDETNSPGDGAAESEGGGSDPGRLDRLLGVLQILVEAASRLRHSAFPAVTVEVSLLKVARLEDPRLLEGMLQKLSTFELSSTEDPPHEPDPPGDPGLSGRGSSARRSTSVALPSSDVRAVSVREQRPAATVTAAPEAGAPVDPASGCSYSTFSSLWGQISIELREQHPQIAAFVPETLPQLDSTQSDTVVLSFDDEFFFQRMSSETNLEVFRTLVRDITREPWNVRLTRGPGGTPASRPSSPGASAPPGPSASSPVSTAPAHAAPANTTGRAAGPAPGADNLQPVQPHLESVDRSAGASNGASNGGPDGSSAAVPIDESELVKKAKRLFNGRLV